MFVASLSVNRKNSFSTIVNKCTPKDILRILKLNTHAHIIKSIKKKTVENINYELELNYS